ncbi:class I SAM-dependent methyltransferase [Cereibacter sphaeroides]|uniref:class I SAM-dependent methyltransferase n=1 Tax=Cereibacter sphaeroides TaxID=1063 RepID=UPI000F531DF9|nr:class I SAM-dependent methyltransferase [Cereibacter sphaeroides]AZB54906.1 class I SAM-dependent methyltransferase [Cereibacter sphaeroides]AZB59157.1 class I SAM-dependent methyltransferase [Cereibacter sphaeroides]
MTLTLAQTLDRCLDIAGNPTAAISFPQRRMLGQALAFLPRQHYRRVLELGCGSGALARGLSARCDHYVGLDADTDALDEASLMPSPYAQTEFRQGRVPEDIPEGPFDLVVLNGVLQDLPAEAIERLAVRLRQVAPSADILCLRSLLFEGPDEAFRPQAALAAALGRPLTACNFDRLFRIDVFEPERAAA